MHFSRKTLTTYILSLISIMIVMPYSYVYGDENQKIFELDTITVTANKRKENVQEIPMSITAFSETELEDAGIEDISGVIDMVPNLTIEKESTVSYRGLGNSMFTGKNPVVIYVDGVPFDDSSNYDAELFNIERVEVLRGPQGTLYGKNAIGGVINVITKKPGNVFESKAGIEIGENETYGVKGFVNGPLINDKLFFGISCKYRETRGFMKNDHPDQDYFDSEERKNMKALLRWLPSDQLELSFHTGVAQIRDGAGRGIGSDKVRYHENRDPDDKSDSDVFTSALNVSYKNKFAEFISITTYKDTEGNFWNNYSYLNWGHLEHVSISDSNAFTQEFRVQSSPKDGGFKWLGGLYYSNEVWDFHDYGVVYVTESTLGYNTKSNWPYALDETTKAVFGQITIPVVLSINFTAGLRYEQTNKETDYKHYSTRTDTGELLSTVKWHRDDDWDALLPKGVLSWDINKDALLYASLSKGYLAGGTNINGDDRETAKFDEQTSLNYEIGIKTAWFNNKFFLNSTFFYVDIDDMHVYTNPSPGIWIASNAAKAHSQGIEIEAKARPLQGLDISAAFGWIDAEFDDYGDYTGKTPTQTPAYTLNLNVQYRHDSGFFIRGEMEGYGKTYYDEANTLKRDPFQLYNAKIGYESSKWDVYLYCNNLLDEEYISSMVYQMCTVSEPRTMGIIASIRF
ncbi:TonB-dependent receptor [uncultured Desulfobacter sp.]|uniref:TonB-dependent receptor n=1 Tax=uncultured Desulfobacter sp. TaxID=240139 RepID=UPI002AA87F21|nr:TonB-dependent receptor [uncultured Desulfobacter sp.]